MIVDPVEALRAAGKAAVDEGPSVENAFSAAMKAPAGHRRPAVDLRHGALDDGAFGVIRRMARSRREAFRRLNPPHGRAVARTVSGPQRQGWNA